MSVDSSSTGQAPRVSVKCQRVSLDRQLGLQSGDALLIVDLQRDFLPGGSMAIASADAIIPRVNTYIAAFDARNLPIFLTRDWHPQNHCSFRSAGGRWPPHCVRGTRGADWPDSLTLSPRITRISKGTEPGTEAYSGFSGTSLSALLRTQKVQRLFVAGLATDYCVHDTVLDARMHGFDVVLLADAICAVNAAPGDETRALQEMLQRGATVFQPDHAAGIEAHCKRQVPGPSLR